MASKSRLTHQATLMLLLLTLRESMHCSGLTVDPPEHLEILDTGHLGRLEIRWSPRTSLINMTECTELYQLEYFNTYKNSWNAIRTTSRSYSAQFDLMKDIRVRVYTLLSGPCTDGTMIKSTNYTELVQKPPSTGIAGTEAQNFVCVNHNMKNLECNWKSSPTMPANSQQYLHFWHKGLQQAEECPKYLISSGVRSGCNFTGISLPDFTDIFFCVNGSSPEGPLKPTYISLQTQNQVKPETAEKLHLRAGPGVQLEVDWDHPVGRIPGRCLEWEVQHNQHGPDGKIVSEQIFTKQTRLTLPSINENERHCFRVRSKLNMYCAERSFWSDWSHLTCHQEKKEVALEPEPQTQEPDIFRQAPDLVPVYVYIAGAIIVVLVLSLCVGAFLKVRRSRQVKRPDFLLTNLFAKTSVVTVTEA